MATGEPDADVQQHDPDQGPPETTDADAQEPHAEPDAPDAPNPDALADEGVPGETDAHPLAPEGKRFKQVYARAKDAETKLQQLREEKARLEGQLEATRTAPPVPEPKVEPRLTW